MRRSEPRLTYEDLRQMPEDGRRYELIDGEIVMSPAPKPRHQMVLTKLFLFLGDAQRAGHGRVLTAPTDVVFDPEDAVTEPDLLFITTDRLQIVGEDYIQGAPDLIVEVLSRSSRRRDLGSKLRLYARYGVRLYWVADPEASVIRVFELQEGAYVEQRSLQVGDELVFPLCPGIAGSVADVFAP